MSGGRSIKAEGFRITAMLWIAVSLLGAVPYLIAGVVPSLTDAVFESVSGFTTTGSSVIQDPSVLPVWLRLWRSLTQWVGGLGLMLLVVALIPSLRGGAAQLYAAEFSGTQQRKFHPHMVQNVRRMWFIYILITIAATTSLMACGNGHVDSLCLALSTVSTGGFMTAADGLASYNVATHWVLTFFMFLSGVNLALIYNFFTLHWHRLKRSDEFVVYLAVFCIAVVVCVTAFAVTNDGFSTDTLQYALFHTASTVSTCGFYTSEPAVWPFAVSVVTFMLILSGAMAGSTGGGIKLRRLMTLSVYMRNYFIRMLHPGVVLSVNIDRRKVEDDYVSMILGFVFLYLLLIIAGAFVLTLTGSGIADAFCLAAANISNLGPSPIINTMGTGLEYVAMPMVAKWTLMVLMLAGRLEVFALLALVTPSYWSRR